MSAFENFGEREAGEEDRMECGVCWRVYDPAEGDPVWQIPAGVPFGRLPADWRCPGCDAERTKFMALACEEVEAT